MNENNSLPLEIIHKILEAFVNGLNRISGWTDSIISQDDLTDTSYSELITLRLISKIWDKAVIPFCFDRISIDDSKHANVILDNWRDDLFQPHFSCPVKTLTIRNLWYSKQEYGKVEEPEETGQKESQPSWKTKSPPVSMSQLERLIKLLGVNLTTLKITFGASYGVSPQVIEAIKTIKDLKSLRISDSSPGSINLKPGIYEPRSVSEFISALPTLECFSASEYSLNSLDTDPPALPNLRCLSFSYDGDEEKVSEIAHAYKDTLKMVELFSADDITGLGGFFEPIKDTIEGLFTVSFSDQIPRSAEKLNCPNLRVVGIQQTAIYNSALGWLAVPMLKNVRTVATDLEETVEWWEEDVIGATVDAVKKMPNFKHIVFMGQFCRDEEEEAINPKLVEAFKSLGIQCHVSNQLTCDEIMELDLKLNGPI